MSSHAKSLNPKAILAILFTVQFINILDFVMVMPLGPDLAKALGVQVSDLGLVGGAYTAAAALGGLISYWILDRVDRKSALLFTSLGLAVGTVLGGFAFDLYSLLAARIWAGIFGGPAASIALAIVADVVPVERRGRAMGLMMTAFSVASVLGIPIGLELARIGDWRWPFFIVGGICFIVAGAAWYFLPQLRAHLNADGKAKPRLPIGDFLRRPTVLYAFLLSALAMLSSFVMIPNLASYVQTNLGYPRADLGMLYLVGGSVNMATTRFAGVLADRIGTFWVSLVGCSVFIGTIYIGFAHPDSFLPVMAIYVFFMVSMSFRVVALQTLISRVPSTAERGGFMGLSTAVQHIASAAGAVASSKMLAVAADGRLIGMERVAWTSIILCAAMPPVMWRLQRLVLVRASSVA